jgi:hypothetical protein
MVRKSRQILASLLSACMHERQNFRTCCMKLLRLNIVIQKIEFFFKFGSLLSACIHKHQNLVSCAWNKCPGISSWEHLAGLACLHPHTRKPKRAAYMRLQNVALYKSGAYKWEVYKHGVYRRGVYVPRSVYWRMYDTSWNDTHLHEHMHTHTHTHAHAYACK